MTWENALMGYFKITPQVAVFLTWDIEKLQNEIESYHLAIKNILCLFNQDWILQQEVMH